MENWYLPITLVPGIGLLILSTSNLMLTLSTEISTIITNIDGDNPIISRKLNQLKKLNMTMVLLYISVACLVVAGLLGGVSSSIGVENNIVLYIAILGILFILSALSLLIVYSFRAISIRQDQFKDHIKNKN